MRHHESVEGAERQIWYEAVAVEQPHDTPLPDLREWLPAQAESEARLRAGDPAEDLARGRWFEEQAAKLVQALIN